MTFASYALNLYLWRKINSMKQNTPLSFYNQAMQETEERLKRLKQISNQWLAAKIIIFIIGVGCLILAIRKEGDFFYYGVAVMFIAYLIAAKWDAKNLNESEKTRRMKQTLQNEMNALNGDFTAFPEGAVYINPSHEYTYDLDIFGSRSLFQRLNRTVTKEGSDRLAQLLSCYPTEEKLIKERQAAIRELSMDGKALMHFIATPRGEEDRLRRYMDILRKRQGTTQGQDRPSLKFFNRKTIMAGLLLLITWTVLICAISGVCSWYLFGLLFFIQLLTGFSLSKKSGQMIGETEGMHKSFSVYLSILSFLQGKTFETSLLQSIAKDLDSAGKSFRDLSHIIQAIYCRINDVMFILMNGMFLFDVFLLRAYECWKQATLKDMDHWIDLLADTDALVSLSVYTFNHPENVDATFLDASSPYILEATGLYHPFLAEEKAVGNDVCLKKSEMMIVTGANMAGKSTFLRTVGINYIMAMNGIPVCAKSLHIRKVSLFSSMRTADNLASHISYFHAELLRLEQLVEFCRLHTHTLIILDEILKGTNSEDKLKGSILFLQKMLLLPVTGIVATHDLKLSDLEQEDAHFQNYCFEIGLGKEISYSYKIKKGVARNLNATYLLNGILAKITPPEEQLKK